MDICFTTGYTADLVFHLLAHMDAPILQNLYSPDYIRRMAAYRPEYTASPVEALCRLGKDYADGYLRLQRLPFSAMMEVSLSALYEQVYCYDRGYTSSDWDTFLMPFFAIAEQENAWYHEYWHALRSRTDVNSAEAGLTNALQPFAAVLRDHGIHSLHIRFSLSLPHSGLGYRHEDELHSVVPFPADDAQVQGCVFQALRQLVKPFTDRMIVCSGVSSADFRHTAFEDAATLCAYEMILSCAPEMADAFIAWAGSPGVPDAAFAASLCMPDVLWKNIHKFAFCDHS